MARFAERMIGAAKLDVHIYEEVERDQTALPQAMGVVILSALAAGIGSAGAGMTSLVTVSIASLVGWFIWAWLTFMIGTKLLPEPETKSDLGEMLRTTGFSAAPGLLRILAFIPALGGLISFAAGLWMLASMIVAVRQALDYRSTGRAIGVCLIGWLVYALVLFLIALALGLGTSPAT